MLQNIQADTAPERLAVFLCLTIFNALKIEGIQTVVGSVREYIEYLAQSLAVLKLLTALRGFIQKNQGDIMSNSIAVTPEQFIFAHDKNLITTSVKIAEVFEKEHKNVLRVIDKTIAQASDSFRQRNFELSQEEQKMPTGGIKKIKSYNLTKDGFMLVVMGFTGKKAFEIKEAYITAFNQMAKKLFPQTQYGLKQLPPLTPKQQRHIQERIKVLVNTQVGATYSSLWGSVKKEFEVGTYKDIQADKYPALCEFLRCEPIEGEILPPENNEAYEYPMETVKGLKTNGGNDICAYHLLTTPEEDRPLSNLLNELRSDGHDISGANMEYAMLRQTLDIYNDTVDHIRKTTARIGLTGFKL